MEENAILYGDPDFTPPTTESLRAGPLTLIYENGELRRIRLGETELVNRIYGAIRGDDWGTPIGSLSEIEKTLGEDSFRIVYESRHTEPSKGIDFVWRGTLTGSADGTITFDFDGEALSTFQRNRIGICVLHPASLTGTPCTIEHPDSSREDSVFPATISPLQPFANITALSYQASQTAGFQIEFTGDIFETEDQRNWLDASYKTYSTPLELPYPVEVPANSRIRQTVTLRIQGETSQPQSVSVPSYPGADSVVVTREQCGRFPGFGLSLPENIQVSSVIKQRIGAVRFDHFRAIIDASSDNWQDTLSACLRQAKRLDAPLMVAIQNGEDLKGALREADAVAEWQLIDPTPEAVTAARASLPAGTHIVGGFEGNFEALNRRREVASLVDALYVPGNPQIHAFDNRSIQEVPPTIQDVQKTVSDFAPGKPLLIGPLTFYGPYHPEDVRQQGLLGASWYLAALSYAAQSGAERITLCGVSGAGGIVSDSGEPYPLYNMLSPIGTATGGTTHRTIVSDPDSIAALAIHSEDEAWQDIFVANLTAQERTISISGLLGESARVRILDARNAPRYSESRPANAPNKTLSLTLAAFAIAQVITGDSIS